ncbi:MAG: ribosomal RNA small subunit methyltransferase A [Candidatus Pacebacteria bacterium]|nr:ribosomal RNA small subunit methyltransferase A [Candidatus Paceibacterota bacterium]
MKHKAKKSLGQNFLKSSMILNKIVDAGEVEKGYIVLEIGPGKGALTEKLLEKAEKVIAIEKDDGLFSFLSEKFEKEIENRHLILENKDILGFEPLKHGLDKTNYKIIANIPYNITGAILKKFLTEENPPKTMVLMVQHEVAKRIIANDNKESILSISVKAYGEPKMVTKVGARYFAPPPKVDSAVILIKNISKKTFTHNKIEEKKFWELVKTGFAHKRKILAGNLRELGPEIDWANEIKKINLNEKIRAEDLSLGSWISLYVNTQNLF